MIGTNGDSLGIRQLQQRIKELEEEKNRIKSDYTSVKISCNVLENRINKAIEYIEEELNCTPSSNRKKVGLILVDYKKILKILKGE